MEAQTIEYNDGSVKTNYGTIRGETSWKRGGYGANANMELIFTLVTEVPDTNEDTSLFDSYLFKIAFWQNAASREYEYFNVQVVDGKDTVTVGTVSNVRFNELSAVIGDPWPTVSANPDSTTFSYTVTDNGATLADGSNPTSPKFWQYDLTNTKRTVADGKKTLKL